MSVVSISYMFLFDPVHTIAPISHFILDLHKNNTIQTLGVSKVFFYSARNTFIQQECIKLIKSDIKEINISDKCCFEHF